MTLTCWHSHFHASRTLAAAGRHQNDNPADRLASPVLGLCARQRPALLCGNLLAYGKAVGRSLGKQNLRSGWRLLTQQKASRQGERS